MCVRVCVFLKNNTVFLHFTQLKEILHLKLFRANTTHRKHKAEVYIFLGVVNWKYKMCFAFFLV